MLSTWHVEDNGPVQWTILASSGAVTVPGVLGQRSGRSITQGAKNMNKDQTHGVTEQVKGKVNEVVGKVTGNRTQEAKGDIQQGLGKAQKAVGDVREDVKDQAKR
jgi:uncharacterized protein YjbJ (UPF0337 family)